VFPPWNHKSVRAGCRVPVESEDSGKRVETIGVFGGGGQCVGTVGENGDGRRAEMGGAQGRAVRRDGRCAGTGGVRGRAVCGVNRRCSRTVGVRGRSVYSGGEQSECEECSGTVDLGG
jgi:hypothetical protein